MSCFMLILTWGGIIFVDILHQVLLLLLCQTTLASTTLNMVAIIKNRNFFNCLLLLYYKSKWAQILCIYMALSSTAYLPFFSVNCFSANLYWLCISSKKKIALRSSALLLKFHLMAKNKIEKIGWNLEIKLKTRRMITGSREPLVFW